MSGYAELELAADVTLQPSLEEASISVLREMAPYIHSLALNLPPRR